MWKEQSCEQAAVAARMVMVCGQGGAAGEGKKKGRPSVRCARARRPREGGGGGATAHTAVGRCKWGERAAAAAGAGSVLAACWAAAGVRALAR